MKDVVVLGRIGYDLYAEEPGVPLAQVRTFSRYLGGSSANMAVGMARQGADVGIVSCLGTDSLSDYLIDFLNAENVETSHVSRVDGHLPSLAFTEVNPPDRFPQVFYRHEAADTRLDLTEEQLDYVARARMFVTNGTSLCASPSRESTYRALQRAKQSGAKVVFDVDYRSMSWRGPEEAGLAVRLALPWIHALIGNDVELKLVAGASDLPAAVKTLSGQVPMLVSKLGSEGTRVWTGGESVFLPPYQVEVNTTIGAGDGFASGFLAALLRDLPLVECLHHGNAAAAIVVSRLSCSEAMPALEEIERMIEEQRR